ncbi:hypothetical protein LCGC14_0541290 [marine sediment metagenome]|uniref:DNA polymerase beta thumb domain-containing protein n=1 Tax=marine sediment metagenome TaxID=412755 RepID=A0A0F9RST2_9ZZZZ
MELERGRKIAAEVIKQLSPYCQKIEVAGSIRRQKEIVHDIDIILIASDAWNLESVILDLARPLRPGLQGDKLKRFTYYGEQVDLYYATEGTWANLLLIRTGSKENNIRLCTLAKKKGWHLSAAGAGLFDESGSRVAGDTEESIYKSLNLPYQEPSERN